MTLEDLPTALADLLAATGAQAAVVWKEVEGARSGFVLASAPAGVVPPESPWPGMGRLPDPPALVQDPLGLGALVPTALRLALPGPPGSALATRLGSRDLALLLVWGPGGPSRPGVEGALEVATQRIAPLAQQQDLLRGTQAEALRLESALSALEQAVVTLDEGRMVGYLNPAAARLLDLPEGALPAPVLAEALRGLQERALNRDEVQRVAAGLLADPLATLAGSVWVFPEAPTHLRVTSAPFQRGSLAGRSWAFDDISPLMASLADAERARADLATREEHFRLVAQHTSDVVIRGSNDGLLEWVSPSVTAMASWLPEEMTGRRFADFVHPEDLPKVRQVQQGLLEGRPARFEARLRTRSDGYRWVSTTVSPVLDAAGKVVARMGGWRDIQAEVEAREALQRSESRLRTTLDHMAEGATLLGFDWTCLYINDLAAAQLFQPRESVVGKRLQDILPDFEDRGEFAVFRACMEGRQPQRVQGALAAPDGSRRWFQLTMHPVPEGIFLLTLDITDSKNAEAELDRRREELEALNRSLETRVREAVDEVRRKDRMLIAQGRQAALGEMIGNIAHQWRQPLSSLAVLMCNLRDDHRFGELDAAVMEASCQRANLLIQSMSQTIRDFQDFFRSGKEAVAFPALEQVQRTVALVEPSFRAGRVDIEVDASADPRLWGFPNEYGQVVLNLLSNARQAIQEKGEGPGTITLRLGVEGGHGCLSVQDTGRGIPEEVLPRIFDPYFTTRELGTGIGLYLSRQIVEQGMGGTIEARNTGDGAEFRVLVPLAAEDR